MTVIIVPGIHQQELTASFLLGVTTAPVEWLIFPTQDKSAYSGSDVLRFLHKSKGKPSRAEPVLFICFSAGVVGAMGAAIAWEFAGGQVKALMAVDGWGVPLTGNFPLHRLSHDYFTHWSSLAGANSFYAEPAVAHLHLWSNPQTTLGWWVKAPGLQVRCSATEFFRIFLAKYEEL
ncbi:MAG: hypothetical protein DSM107014_05380 [Gomphosphaeria aponina SAG 52.96 = DSM 107014]|uniref:Uncharacterized protein n=1 Tax=Gomphosphaeria aponina SAG 52.96 = DSM 107014 TaxID=1521640 RepID=A0A941GUJ0_9CHRO|nr:hypothetical protein [Gomphosphaeria aponina SAG 52.96 = DSM 107014]